MTAATTTKAAAPARSVTSRWQRHRATFLIIGGFVLAVIVVIVLGGGGAQTTEPLDPDNPGPGGAQALARVLDDQGVDITVVRNADELDDAEVGPGTTVLVTSTDYLGESTTERLLDHTADTRLVLAGPGPGATAALGFSRLPGEVALSDGRAAACQDPLFAELTIEVDRALAYPGGPGDPGCFPGDEGSLVVERDAITLFGAAEALTNDQILRADNAAVVVRLLGQDDRLVWYVPSIDDLVGDDGVSLETLLPRWIRPGLWLGGFAVLALIGWRGRRLGPLAIEPLPVVVKAIETTRSRGRLYRRAGDRAHAAAALRGAARTSAAGRLRLGSSADPDAVVRDVARHLGRSETAIGALIGTQAQAPATDIDLINLASDLAALDREVRRR